MSRNQQGRNQRSTVRIPLACPVRIRTLDLGPSFYGTCTDLSVGGLTIQSSFVPAHDEELEVTVMPPRNGGKGFLSQPMTARVRVRRCNEIERGVCYEIGMEIVKILS